MRFFYTVTASLAIGQVYMHTPYTIQNLIMSWKFEQSALAAWLMTQVTKPYMSYFGLIGLALHVATVVIDWSLQFHNGSARFRSDVINKTIYLI